MKIIVQEKKFIKDTQDILEPGLILDDGEFEGHSFIALTIEGSEHDSSVRLSIELPISDLFTAVEAFHRHEVRYDEEQLCLRRAEQT